jgi:hypothetical protein
LRVPAKEFLNPGKLLRYHRATGLIPTQMQELVRRISAVLDKPWVNGAGRPKALGPYKAVAVTCMYLRQNSTQDGQGPGLPGGRGEPFAEAPGVSRVVDGEQALPQFGGCLLA